MTTMRDEHAPMFGNDVHYTAQDRHVGYNQPPWLSTNQNTGQLQRLQIPFSPPGVSTNVSQFAVAHSLEETTDNVWSGKHDGTSYEHHYPGPESFPDNTQGFGYSNKPTAGSCSDVHLYEVDQYQGHHVSRGDMRGD